MKYGELKSLYQRELNLQYICAEHTALAHVTD
jgi:hypothetical protein